MVMIPLKSTHRLLYFSSILLLLLLCCFFSSKHIVSRHNCSIHYFSIQQLISSKKDKGFINSEYNNIYGKQEDDCSILQYIKIFDNESNFKFNNKKCHIQFMRSFLPTTTTIITPLPLNHSKFFHNNNNYVCDKHLSLALDQWFLHNTISIRHTIKFKKVSMGKFIFYNALMQYNAIIKSMINNEKNGIDKNKLLVIDIFAPRFSWTKSINICRDQYSDWNCGFLSLKQLKRQIDLKSNISLLNNYSPENIIHHQGNNWNSKDTTFLRYGRDFYNFDSNNSVINDNYLSSIWRSRLNKPNHSIQMILFGKLISLMTRPTPLVQDFMTDHLVVVNGNLLEKLIKEQSANANSILISTIYKKLNCHQLHYGSCSFASISDFHDFMDIFERTSISLHVRGGDSCDFIIDNEIERMTTYRQNDKRPCFSINVYMKKLKEMKNKYNINVILLATDSLEMIEKMKLDKSFIWIYNNVSRNHFDKSHGSIECRKDEDNYLTYFSAIADIELLRYGNYFLGTFASLFSKLVYYIIIGEKGRFIPFVSLDFPLGCESISSCDDSDIEKNGFSIDKLIIHAFDCEAYKGDLCQLDVNLNELQQKQLVENEQQQKQIVKLSSDYPDGTVLKYLNKEVYIFYKGYRRSLPDWEYLTCLININNSLSIISLPREKINLIPLGDPWVI